MKPICSTCGTGYTGPAPTNCLICEDDRQYVKATGQEWTTQEELLQKYIIKVNSIDPSIYTLQLEPSFAIGHKAHLLLSPGGNLLWDCLPMLDKATIDLIHLKGGLKAIAISHPHYYGVMAYWASVFNCPVYLHAKDEEWVLNNSEYLHLWEGREFLLWDEMKIIHTGGHFPGSTILYAPQHGNGGSLFTGDSIYIAPSLDLVSFMYSYPNYIPLPKQDILYIKEQVEPLKFDSMYGAFNWMIIDKGARHIFDRSIRRYLTIYD